MIGSGLKKLATANGMKIAKGVAYGSLRGFAAALSEGAGFKQIVLSTHFPEASQMDALRQAVSLRNITQEFRVQQLNFSPDGIQIVFLDNPGTMKRIEAFIDWFFPLLSQYGATNASVCPVCGMQVTAGKWILQDGVTASYVHYACADQRCRAVQENNEMRQLEDTGSYGRGVLGALLGAAIGSLLWALILCAGYMAAIVGFVIGWLANKGYDLLKGKQGKAKVAILVVAVIFGVLLGTFLGDAFSLGIGILSGDIIGYELADIPGMILLILLNDPQSLAATVGNVVMGLLFAGLGVFTLLRKASQEVAGQKVIILD